MTGIPIQIRPSLIGLPMFAGGASVMSQYVSSSPSPSTASLRGGADATDGGHVSFTRYHVACTVYPDDE